MTITKLDPNKVHLGGMVTIVDDLPAVETITPGMLLEYHNNSGALAWGVHDAAADVQPTSVALERSELNKGVSDNYAADDLVKAGILHPGSTFWAILPSGQNVNPGDYLQSNGDGKLKNATADTAAAGVAKFVALEAKTPTADTRCRVQVL